MKHDAIFPSDNEWGVPDLLPQRQAQLITPPVRAWGSIARKSRMQGTWHFYVDDSKFSAVWKDPSVVLETRCKAAVELNYSMGVHTPKAVAIGDVFKKRWCSRYWQEHGVDIIVDVFVPVPLIDMALIGVPHGWHTYATRGSDLDLDATAHRAWAAEGRAGPNRTTFLVYGGGGKTQALCRDRGWIYVPNTARAGALRGRTEVGDGRE